MDDKDIINYLPLPDFALSTGGGGTFFGSL
jgi:hypothetical protein